MAARIIGVTFETETQSRPGVFTVPRAAANVLEIGDDDPVELRVTWEGRRLELRTQLQPGLEVDPRQSDETTSGLASIPARTPVTVTVWRLGQEPESHVTADGRTAWSDERFDTAFVNSGGPSSLITMLRDWARERDVALRYGTGRSAGPLHFDARGAAVRTTLLAVGADARIEWIFRDNLERSPGFRASSTRIEFVRRLAELFDVDRPDERANVWFGVPAERLPESKYEDFAGILDEELDLVMRGMSGLRAQYQRLFTAVLARFKGLRPGFTNRDRVGTDNWLDLSSGRSGIRFTWSTAFRKYLRVELYIDVGSQAENKRLFDKLRERAGELEEEIGQPISWERLENKRASRLAIYSRTPTESFDTDEELIEWAAQTMAQFIDVLRPLVLTL